MPSHQSFFLLSSSTVHNSKSRVTKNTKIVNSCFHHKVSTEPYVHNAFANEMISITRRSIVSKQIQRVSIDVDEWISLVELILYRRMLEKCTNDNITHTTRTFFYETKSLFRAFSAADSEFLVVNAVGPDRPGIVSDFTKLVVDQEGSVGESQASRLGSHFGLMMLITVPKAKSEALQTAVKKMSDMNTSCYLTGDPNAVEVTPKDGCELVL
jgi:predicted amino acid-binding ACT domain protein